MEKNNNEIKGQKELRESVLLAGMCTNCGACVNICPYNVAYKDQTIIMDSCNREDGKCYAFCPRTPTDLEALRRMLFNYDDITPELGPMKGFYMTRAADQKTRSSSQHGGTAATLIALSLQEGIIDSAIMAEEETKYLPHGVVVKTHTEVASYAKSKFVVSPTVATFNDVSKHKQGSIGVVATPCQALAFAKMRLKPFPENDNKIDNLRLVIGLFCGWALSWRQLKQLLTEKIKSKKVSVLGMDIPPSKYHCMEVYTNKGIIKIPLDEIMPCVREACSYCCDMTAEFSDISVGSARSPKGWEDAKGWNQVIVRTDVGQELIDLARSRGVLEFRDMPDGNLEKLKKASMNKKRLAVKKLSEKSGNSDNLLYLDIHDPVLCKLKE